MSKTWEEIWPEVERILQCTTHPKDIEHLVSQLRGGYTTWEAIKRARRRFGGGTPAEVPPQLRPDPALLKLPTMKVKKPGKPTTQFSPCPGDTWLYASDIHFGIEDVAALRAMIRAAWECVVDAVILAGDIFDCYSLSRYDHTPFPKREVYTIEGEAKRAEWFWDELREMGADVHMLPGNHEDRAFSLEKNNPGLVNSISIRALFNIPDFVEVHEQNSRLLAGDLVIEHGHKLPGSLSTNGAGKVLKDHPYQTTMYGHTHRFETKMHTIYLPDGSPRTFGAYSIGHLSVSEHHIDYSPDSSWQTGFALIHWRQSGERVVPSVEPVVITDGGFIAMGKEFNL